MCSVASLAFASIAACRTATPAVADPAVPTTMVSYMAEVWHPRALVGQTDAVRLALVRATEPLGHHAHHRQREGRVLLHEEHEVLLVDPHDACLLDDDGRRAARARVDQRHLADDAAGTDDLDDPLADSHLDLALDDREHRVAGLSLGEEGRARRGVVGVGGVPEEVYLVHCQHSVVVRTGRVTPHIK